MPRLLQGAVTRATQVMPVVVLTGARQTGKSTFVRDLLSDSRAYFTLDDFEVREQALRAPTDLVERVPRLTLDEVQRAPDLLFAIKQAVDRDRQPGRFILTGSANLLLMKRVSESLAGRASYLTLWPMTRAEALGQGRGGLWTELMEAPFGSWLDILHEGGRNVQDWKELALRGGYPTPALELFNRADRAIWFEGYVRTYLERDLQDLSSIDNLIDFRRLMRATSLRLGQLVNQSDLGRDVQLPQPTVHRWLNLLETSYQLVRLPAYAVNRTKILIKAPKAYWCDAGLALHLAGATDPSGSHLENLILSDLLAWRDAQLLNRPEVYYWRTRAGEEVDLVIEQKNRLVGVEVKATSRPRVSDARHLRTFLDEYGDSVDGCLLLHGGDRLEVLAPRVLAAPWWMVI
jgi:uncharacterized protein